MELKIVTIISMAYKLFERIGTQLIGIIVSILLSRLLDTGSVGVATLAETFILFFSIVTTYGLGNSLIQDKYATETDYSTIFFSSILFSFFLYLIVFFLAPFMEVYFEYGAYNFCLIVRVLGLSIFATSIKSVQQALIAKKLAFKNLFYSSLFAIVISGTMGVLAAYRGWGVWALVIQFMSCEFVGMIILALLIKWKPQMVFSLKSLKKNLNFGWKLMFVGFFNVSYAQIRNLVIAKKYSASELAYFNRGFRLAKIVPENLGETLMAVLFPVFSNFAEKDILLSWIRRSVRLSSYIVFPLSVGLFVVADNIIILLLTSKWANSIVYLRLFCLAYLFYTIEQIIDQSIKALGYSGLLLKINIFKNGMGLVLLLLLYKNGVFAIAGGLLISVLMNYIISVFIAKKLFRYSFHEQMGDISEALIISAIMGIVCWMLNFVPINIGIKLVLQIIAGGAIYIGLSICFKVEAYRYSIKLIREFIEKQKHDEC